MLSCVPRVSLADLQLALIRWLRKHDGPMTSNVGEVMAFLCSRDWPGSEGIEDVTAGDQPDLESAFASLGGH